MARVLIGVIMGSESDLAVMSEAVQTFEEFGVTAEIRILSAHRTPEAMANYASTARSRGLKVIIAGAGGSAHLPGMTASHTPLPVIAVPIKKDSHDHEALWSNIRMPSGVPLATMPENGARNAALLAIEILAIKDKNIAQKYDDFRAKQQANVTKSDKQLQASGWKEFLKSQ